MFKKKALTTALVAGLAVLGAADIASAVYVNPDNTGQVLIYPYYSVRNGKGSNQYFSTVSVTNTTNTAKAVKVRFLEAKNSKEVLDFNLFLSPKDVWTAAILATADGAKVVSGDTSCITPSKLGASGVDFVNYAYLGDGGGDSLDRTREGYVEIIEMGDIKDAALATTVTHVAGTPPCNSGLLDTVDNAGAAGGATYFTVGSGGLAGNASLVNVNNGVSFSYVATALDAFTQIQLFNAAGTIKPNLIDVNPAVASVFDRGAANNYGFGASPRQIDPVSAVLMHQRVMNDYTVESATASGTDWVLTFPTKTFLVNPSSQTAVARKPFENVWTGGKSCDTLGLSYYDREEQTPGVVKGFSPPQPGAPASALCYEANVLTFNTGNILGSALSANVALNSGYQAGWLDLTFPRVTSQTEAHWLQSDETPIPGYTLAPASTFNGLPLVGFAVNDATNGTLTVGTTNVISSYGFTFGHKTQRVITTP